MNKKTLIFLGVASQVIGAAVAVWAWVNYKGGKF